MDKNQPFGLIKNENMPHFLKCFPRYPIYHLTLRPDIDSNSTFAVVDLSRKGLQLALFFGEHSLNVNQQFSGQVHWEGLECDVMLKVEWIEGQRAGLSFSTEPQELFEMLSVDNLANKMKKIERNKPLDFSSHLIHWFRSDGPVEIFIWNDSSGIVNEFEILYFNSFIHYSSSKGKKMGRIIRSRRVDTPLSCEEEFELSEQNLSDKVLLEMRALVNAVKSRFSDIEEIEFIRRQI